MAGSSNRREGKNAMVPKPELLDFDVELQPPYATFSGNVGDNVASSSGSQLRSFFVGMGFQPSLVDKAIEENGDQNSDRLLEVLLSYSALQKSNSESSDSLESLFDDKDSPEISTVNQPKEELDEFGEFIDDKRSSLLMMNFSAEEVDFAISKLGDGASVPELVDFIFAAQIAKKLNRETVHIKRETIDITCDDTGGETSNERLFGIMEKTLQLLEMGFSENEVSSAVDRLGTEVPISELANYIFAEQSGIEYVMEYKYPFTSMYSMGIKEEQQWDGTAEVKTECFGYEAPQSGPINFRGTFSDRGKRVKEEGIDEFANGASDMGYSDFMENDRSKRPKNEYEEDESSSFLDIYWMEERVDAQVARMTELHRSKPARTLSDIAAKSPFFLFGNVSNISYESWTKMSQFLYVEPEFVNTRFFSALNRIEGYLHNLPFEGRTHILPKPPLTIEETMPRTTKWWPSWDSRKQLSSICCETNGISRHCEWIGKILADSGGVPTPEQQEDIVRSCRILNLVWTGQYKLSPVEPDKLEFILGYPLDHTSAVCNLAERLELLKYCFQTDTLGYHLSVLKPLFPHGLTVLSIFSGIGGAEIALHRLGIKMKAVVSVETSEAKRKILERWWRVSGQKGNLVQMEEVQKLTGKTLQGLINQFGVFDLVIYQHPNSYASSRIDPTGRHPAFDFSLFVESVRLLHRVRGLCKRS